jgi:amino acid adenylation domain-containing protein
VVGVYGFRSFDLIASLIAIFLSGGILLSIDHTLPDQRKQLMLREANAKFLISIEEEQQLSIAWADSIMSANLLRLSRFSENRPVTGELIDLSTVAFPEISVHDPAYIFFTSGTTGVPKGVLGTHQGLSHFLKWQRDTFVIHPQDRAAQLTALSFDVVLRDIFIALISGATLCLPPDSIYLNAKATLQWLQKTHISIVHTVPALAQAWLSIMPTGVSLPDLRWIFFAGEPLKDTLVNQWRANFPHGQIVNFYGPTETTMAKCFYQIPQDPSPGVQPVGSPLPQTQALVINRAGQLCGIGEPGEIIIRTPFRTRGYINAPEENDRKFLPNPFRKDAQDKCYYSGDRGCFRPDGQLEIIGRIDNQVKIRGIRIELGEIESVLGQHSDIQQAVVSVWGEGDDDKRLIAHVVPYPKHTLQLGELRPFLKKQLPEYMIPSVFMPLDIMPLTSNGKINRTALPFPEESRSAVQHMQLPARDDIEEKLVKIWEELLRVHPIGIQDNFFELGGHSLMAVHLFAQINSEFGVNMPLATLFQEATIEHLAKIIRQQNGIATWSSLIEIEPHGDHLPFFCVHGITGDILWFRDLAHCLAGDIPFYGLQSRGLDGIQAPLARIEDMAAHYIEEIRRVQPSGPYYLGGASFGGAVALEIAQQFLAQQDDVAQLAIFDHALPNVNIDLNGGKLKRRLLVTYRILKNFPRWLKEFLQMGPTSMLQRIRRKIRLAQKNNIKKEQADGIRKPDAEDLIDFASELSPHRQELITSNYQALKRYVPKPYAGRVSFFRATSRPLLNVFDPETSWQKLAPGRVSVFEVPGSHEGMFKRPYVEDLSTKLKACLDG